MSVWKDHLIHTSPVHLLNKTLSTEGSIMDKKVDMVYFHCKQQSSRQLGSELFLTE